MYIQINTFKNSYVGWFYPYFIFKPFLKLFLDCLHNLLNTMDKLHSLMITIPFSNFKVTHRNASKELTAVTKKLNPFFVNKLFATINNTLKNVLKNGKQVQKRKSKLLLSTWSMGMTICTSTQKAYSEEENTY